MSGEKITTDGWDGNAIKLKPTITTMQIDPKLLANNLYKAMAHGDAEHRAWLRGTIAGYFSAIAGDRVEVKE